MKVTIQEQVGTTCGSADPTVLKTGVFPPGALVCIQKVVAVNKSANNSRVIIKAGDGVDGSVLGMIVCTSDQLYYEWDGPVHLKNANRLSLEFTNVSSGDVVEGYVFGYYVE